MADEQFSVPVDKGWAWVVLTGCVLEITVYGGIMKSFGLFFIQFQMRFNSSTFETAVVGLVQNATLSICSVFVMTIGLRKFSSRVSVFSGGVFTVTGFLLTAFTTDISVFYFGQGFLCGLGMSLIHAPELAVIGVYFNRHKALANGIFTGGAAVGGLVFAPIIVQLFEVYKYTGAMLIISGLLMHICVGALLMRPPDFYTKEASVKVYDDKNILEKGIKADDVVHTCVNSALKTDKIQLERVKLFRSMEIVKAEVHHDEKSSSTALSTEDKQTEPLIYRVRAHSIGSKVSRVDPNLDSATRSTYNGDLGKLHTVMNAISKSNVALFSSSEGLCGSVINLSNSRPKHDNRDNEKNDEIKQVNCLSSIKTGFISLLGTVFDLHLMRNPVFLVFLLLTFTFMTAHTIVPNFIPTHAKEVGITNENIGFLIAVMAAVSMFARIFVGIAIDRKCISWSTALALMAFITGTSCHLLRFANTFPTLMIFVVVVGFCSGQYHSLYAVILLDVIGPEKFKSSLGFGTLVHGASSALFFPVTGILRDVSASYIVPYHLLGGLAYVSGVLVLLMPKIKTRQESAKR